MEPMGHVRRFDHIGITVEGEFVETVCGIPGAHCEITMLRPPDGGSRALELRHT
jgi:hypothetical protein